MTKKLLTAALMLGFTVGAQALPIQYNFTATDFTGIFYGTQAPQSTVSGSYTFDGDVLTDLNILIGSQQYTIANTLVNVVSPSYVIGGSDHGASTIYDFVDDFIFLGAPLSAYPYAFTYSILGGTDFFRTENVSVTQSVASVPEPSSLVLLAAGLVGITFARRRASKAKHQRFTCRKKARSFTRERAPQLSGTRLLQQKSNI